ncbi:hypothetical protein F5884DRAFT_738123 [Xylogone sp. PMI_703]|nr:hypothetical protein F5884DRAFT_738123 [Xylogone sp. PMI_703]
MFWPFKRLHYYDKKLRNVLHLLKTNQPEVFNAHELDKPSGPTEPVDVPVPTGSDETDSEALSKIKDLEALLGFMDHDLVPTWNLFRDAKSQTASFEELWFVFRPGDICFAPISANSRRYQETWRVLCTTGGRPQVEPPSDSDGAELKINPFTIRCYYIDFDGARFFPVVHDFVITPFEGEVFLPSLTICPSRFVVGGRDIEAEFRNTGEIFRDLTKFKSFYYSETTLVGHPCGCSTPKQDEQISEYIESPVVVDFSEALRNHRDWLIDEQLSILGPLPAEQHETRQYEKFTFTLGKSPRKLEIETGATSWSSDGDEELDELLMEEFISRNNFLRRFRNDLNSTFEDLDKDDLVLLPPRVFGFVLRSRKFALLKVNHLEPVRRNEDGFARLKLPDGHKRMVQSLVIHHMNEMNERLVKGDSHEYDIVRGKGRGLIVLLHGAPGVGKTSTAECVANASGRPLFPITCGDLGVEASEVEQELEQKFHLAQRWNCVLLLDEADVFLTQRSRSDIKHNSLVSVFLRVLEYYTGILFLTTNRVGAFDMAFKSRIHISLYYPPLGHKQTLDIWKMNLDALQNRKKDSLLIAKDKIIQFAKTHYINMRKNDMQWNGRQIRNAVQTAVALAEYEHLVEKKKQENQDGETLKAVSKPCELLPKHFETVALAAEEFDNHLMEIYGAGEDERAFNRMDRARNGDVKNPFRDREEYKYVNPQQSNRRGMYASGSSHSYSSQHSRSRSNIVGRGTGRYYGTGNQEDDDYEEEDYQEEIEQDDEAEESPPQPRNPRRGGHGLAPRGGRGGSSRLSPTPEPLHRRRGVSPRLNDQEDAQDEQDSEYIMWNDN